MALIALLVFKKLTLLNLTSSVDYIWIISNIISVHYIVNRVPSVYGIFLCDLRWVMMSVNYLWLIVVIICNMYICITRVIKIIESAKFIGKM